MKDLLGSDQAPESHEPEEEEAADSKEASVSMLQLMKDTYVAPELPTVLPTVTSTTPHLSL